MKKKHKIGIIGCGFVGTAVETGFQSVADIRVYDKFKDTESLDSVVDHSDILFICLPTPMNDDGSCDLSIIENSIKDIDEISSEPKTFIIKSTVQPGTTARLAEEYPEHYFMFSPEYLTEDNFIEDFMNQDRIVLGYPKHYDASKRFGEPWNQINDLMQDFTQQQDKPALIYHTNSSVAEMAKYIANCFLATKVTFFNEIKQIREQSGVEFDEAVSITLLDKRIGKSHYRVPGPDGYHGWGKSCFSKDLNSLIFFAKQLEIDPLFLQTVWTKNLLVREVYDWENLAQVNGDYSQKE